MRSSPNTQGAHAITAQVTKLPGRALAPSFFHVTLALERRAVVSDADLVRVGVNQERALGETEHYLVRRGLEPECAAANARELPSFLQIGERVLQHAGAVPARAARRRLTAKVRELNGGDGVERADGPRRGMSLTTRFCSSAAELALRLKTASSSAGFRQAPRVSRPRRCLRGRRRGGRAPLRVRAPRASPGAPGSWDEMHARAQR